MTAARARRPLEGCDERDEAICDWITTEQRAQHAPSHEEQAIESTMEWPLSRTPSAASAASSGIARRRGVIRRRART